MSALKSSKFESFGVALKEALDQMGVTPTWLANITGKDKGQISKYINNRLFPKRVIQLELTKHLIFDVEQAGSEWILVKKINNSDRVEESSTSYEVINYKDEKKYLLKMFEDIRSIENIFNEIESNSDLDINERKLQIEMIKERLAKSIKNIPGTEK